MHLLELFLANLQLHFVVVDHLLWLAGLLLRARVGRAGLLVVENALNLVIKLNVELLPNHITHFVGAQTRLHIGRGLLHHHIVKVVQQLLLILSTIVDLKEALLVLVALAGRVVGI